MKIDKHDIAIAALLHDIGKVMQRAEIPIHNEFLNRCPTRHGHPTHLHVTWTEEFFEKFKYIGDEYLWQQITNLAASHHNLPSFANKDDLWLAQCIMLADRISAKWDRKPEETSGMMYKKRPLYPVFESIHLEYDKENFNKQIPFISLGQFEKNLLNSGDAYIKADETTKKCPQYKELYLEFEKEYEVLMQKWNKNEITKVHFVDALDSLLEQYFWCVPSNTIEEHPTNSLYHHSKTTAAVSVGLFDYCKNGNTSILNDKLIDSDEKLFLLLGGDLSGIQSYIFDLNPENSKGVSKTLRARSFKVKILSEMTLYHIIKKLNITRQNILMNAGGKFMILLPKNEEITSKLKELQRDIDATFYEGFQGMLSLNIDWNTDIAFRELGMDTFKDTLDRFMDNLEQAKKRKFSTSLQNANWNTDEFRFDTELYSKTVCEICNRNPSIDPGEERICLFCKRDLELGRQLPKNNVGIITSEKPAKDDKILVSLFNDELHFYLKDKPPSRLYKDAEYFLLSEMNCPYIPLKPTATYLPKHEGDALVIIKKREEDNPSQYLTFSEIAQCAKSSDREDRNKMHGTEMLGVLKGDVDNLGLLFNLGLPDKNERLSLTSYSTFSGLMDFFFSQYVPALIEKDFSYIYVIYTGGDDFALVGPWNQTLDFVIRLSRDFSFFTCQNSDIHFSAGIELMRGKAPIKNSIYRAEEALKKSKEDDKNAITFFDTTVKWKEAERLLRVAKQFQNFLDNLNGFSMQFLYRLFSYHEMYQRFKSEHNPEDLMYISHINYDTRRNIYDKKQEKQLVEECKELMQRISQNNDNLMEYLRIPLSKVIYENR